ncbi:O-methyltransferase gliM [Aspergillus stella-maris]|uniref:O-methyltransferase gliM n=1 Tax=Aspergillus stella-maris TaxID=1810926 RepID=UPI003CCE0406
MAPSIQDDNPSNDEASTPADLVNMVGDLIKLKSRVQRLHSILQTPAARSWLDRELHSYEKLPDKELEELALELVDSMDQLQLDLVPSISLLTDGFFGYLNSKALWAVVDAHVADHLATHGPQGVSPLGLRCGIQPQRLDQLLDTLVNNGIFAYDASTKTYSNNRASALLTHDHWSQWHLWSDLYPNEFFNVSRSLPAAVKIGEARTAAQIEYGTDLDLFEYLAKEGKLAKFQRTLGAGAVAQAQGLTVDYPWGELGDSHIMDIGGGSGAFLASLLRAHPRLSGSLVDLKSVIELITPDFRNAGGKFADVGDRVAELVVGDFTRDIPPAAVYTMKWCLHDWMDDDVVTILKNVRRSIVLEEKSRFLVIESVKVPGRSGRLPRYGDLTMMITCNGKERSKEDWKHLGELAGWRIEKMHRVRRAWPCVIDFRPA